MIPTAMPWQRPATAWKLDGRVLRVQCPPVLELVPLLQVPTVYLVLTTLTDPDDQQWLYRELIRYRSPVTDDLLEQVADGLVFTWCGVPRWLARRVWLEILGRWPGFEGPLTAKGVDVRELDAARATRLVWSTLQSWHANDKDQGESWRARTESPPVPTRAAARTRRPRAQEATDADSFMSVYAAVGGRAG